MDLVLDNATNKVYAVASPASVGNEWFLDEPRTVTLTLNAAF